MIRKSSVLLALIISAFIWINSSSASDSFLRVYATYNDGRDTTGVAEHFLVYGLETPVFIAPFTSHFTIFPLADSSYKATVTFTELGPEYAAYERELTFERNLWQTIDSLNARGIDFTYHFVVFEDTTNYFDYLPTDSLTNNESIHFKSWIWRDSYADYKWEARKDYLENIYNFYRKEHQVKRSGKLNLYVFPGSNTSPLVDNISGVNYDFTRDAMYTVFNPDYDSALPQYAQLYVLYDTWGYTARSLAVGYARYFLDDIYRARKIMANMNKDDIRRVISREYNGGSLEDDIICGAFARYLIDHYGVPMYQKLYEGSLPGKFAFEEVFKKSFDDLLDEFINYERYLKLSEPNAQFFSEIYRSQMWFDKALEYDIWLGTQQVKRDYHLKILGATFFEEGNYEESEKAYKVLVERNPGHYDAKYLLGLACLRNGKTKDAIKEMTVAADSFPDAAKMLAEYYLDRGDLDSASTYLDKISEYPDSWTALLKGRLALARGQVKIGEAIIKRGLGLSNNVISMVPGEARGYIDAAYCFMFDSLYKEAESDLQIALFLDQRPYYRGAAYLGLGRLYDIQGEHDKAKEYYDKAIEANAGEYMKALAKKYRSKPFKI